MEFIIGFVVGLFVMDFAYAYKLGFVKTFFTKWKNK